MGGVGKTQLVLAYVQQHDNCYESAIWLNATPEATLKASFRSIAARLLTISEYEKHQDQ
jgi:hypothetical protein